jgi:segregation and condensation protein A
MYEERIYDLIFSRELTWEGLIRDIVREERMDPWDIDISSLANRYVETIKKIEDLDFKISGKFLLTAAILLRMKSDLLFIEKKIEVEEVFKGIDLNLIFGEVDLEIIPKISVPRKRRVTLEELILALRKALEVRDRRKRRWEERRKAINLRKLRRLNLLKKITELYLRIKSFFRKFGREEISFSELIPSKRRKDLIWTFIPLLHLANSGKIVLRQEEDFDEIWIKEGEQEAS